MRAELLKTHLKSVETPKNMQDVVAEAKAVKPAQKVNKLITDATKGIEEQVNWISHKQMKLKREPGTCFWCVDRHGPHPWKTCPANGKTCTKHGINDHFSRVCLETGPPQQEQPRRTTPWQAQGRGRSHRTPCGQSQPKPPREQNIHLLQTATDEHPVEYNTDDYQEQWYRYSLETWQIHKGKELCYPAHLCNWEQIHPSDIPIQTWATQQLKPTAHQRKYKAATLTYPIVAIRDPAKPSPSKPIMIHSKRCLAPSGNSQRNIYSNSILKTLKAFAADVSPVQMAIHRVPVAKRIKEKEALDRYTAAGII